MIKLIIVEDHALFRLGLRAAIQSSNSDIAIVGEAEDGKTLFELLETVTPDIIILDVILPHISGIEIAHRLKRSYPQIKILVVSAENTESVVQALIEEGANGFISKNQCTTDELITAIQSIMDGIDYFGQDIASIIYNIYVSKIGIIKSAIDFTPREIEVINLCKEGLLSKEIAGKLNISRRTVDSHKNNIFKKLGINNTMEMVQYALKCGIVKIT
ncbi:response regulator transcription factor [Bacteroidales bacterium OttesenSCG-928-C03]|nr:response regulator transcription factor [Bacteroidales bacterium OttesenSCG-928-E04]MDL2309312.1 response regulator transcription factor [Bacteroidales bacterium OttesenSCG-928-C03]MDL2326953.1 response regulator transcription factor [Bacteroidales bacterium OttesenSCG-928-A14]